MIRETETTREVRMRSSLLLSGNWIQDVQVYALVDADADGVAETAVVLREDLGNPHGLAWHGGSLYIATPGVIYSAADIDGKVIRGETPVSIHCRLVQLHSKQMR